MISVTTMIAGLAIIVAVGLVAAAGLVDLRDRRQNGDTQGV